MANFNLFKVGQIVHQTKESIYLYINQKVRVNLADLLTKFNISRDDPKYWNELQIHLLQGSWLAQHPKFWLSYVIKESEQKIKKQAIGMPITDFTTMDGISEEPKKISVKQISITLHPNPNMSRFLTMSIT